MVLDENPKAVPTVKKQLSAADLVVLSLLAEDSMHGYRLVAELDRRDAKDWAEISRPQVYYSLKKLLKMRLVVASANVDEALGPERAIYKINAAGKKAMNEALCESRWAEQRPPPPFLTWMALSSHLSASETEAVVRARRKFLAQELRREQLTLEAFGKDDDKMMTAGRLMVSLTIDQFQTELTWLETVLKELPKARK